MLMLSIIGETTPTFVLVSVDAVEADARLSLFPPNRPYQICVVTLPDRFHDPSNLLHEQGNHHSSRIQTVGNFVVVHLGPGV
jgi:hypothetical protein